MRHRTYAIAAFALLGATISTSTAQADVFSLGSGAVFRYTDAGVSTTPPMVFSEGYTNIDVSPDGYVYTCGNTLGYGTVERIDPRTNEGQSVLPVNAQFTQPSGFALGAGGNFYAGSLRQFATQDVPAGPAVVLHYSTATNQIAPFATIPTTVNARSLVFDLAVAPGGDVYAATDGGVVRFSGAGALLGTPVPNSAGGSGAIAYSGGRIAFGPDGKLYVASPAGDIVRVDPITGASLGTLVAANAGANHTVSGLTFAADGKLYVTSGSTGQLLRYNATSGAFVDVFLTGQTSPFINPASWDSVVVVPEPAALLAMGWIGLAARRRRR